MEQVEVGLKDGSKCLTSLYSPSSQVLLSGLIGVVSWKRPLSLVVSDTWSPRWPKTVLYLQSIERGRGSNRQRSAVGRRWGIVSTAC